MIDALCEFTIFFAGFMSLTIAMGLVLEDEKKTYHYLFAILMLFLGALQILNGLLVTGKLMEYPALIFWYLPFLVLIGPMFFLTFRSANDDSFQIKPVHYLHFSNGIITIPLLVPLVMLDAPAKKSLIMQAPVLFLQNPMFRLYSILFAIALINITGYIFYFIRECLFMLDYRLIREKKISPYLIIFMLIAFPLMLIFLGCMLAINMVDQPESLFFGVMQWLTTLSFLLTLLVFVMEKKKINFFRLLNMEIEKGHREVSRTKNLDIDYIMARIKTLLEDEKIFRDEDLSVNSMARELGIEPYQLSIVINDNFNKNFKNLINEYRIMEAKKILLADMNRTITSVAYAVGFNSTTVFYEWFRRHTSVSPKKFRDINRNTTRITIHTTAGD